MILVSKMKSTITGPNCSRPHSSQPSSAWEPNLALVQIPAATRMFFKRSAKIENPVPASQYFDANLFLSVVKQ
jgi:hypothetical protein